MRDEVREAFDEMTEGAHPALREQLRSRMLAGPARGQSWSAAAIGVAAALLVAVTVAYALLAGGGRPAASVPATISSSPSPVPSVTPAAPTPSPSLAAPTPSPSAATGPSSADFVCGTIHGDSAATSARVTQVRVGPAAGYDRFVIEFDGPVPSFTVALQDSPVFTEDASGRTLTLLGSRGVAVRVQGATGAQTYNGPTDFTPGYPGLKEARRTGDFEAVLHWGLGIGANGCIRAFTLTAPDRLVVDVQHPA